MQQVKHSTDPKYFQTELALTESRPSPGVPDLSAARSTGEPVKDSGILKDAVLPGLQAAAPGPAPQKKIGKFAEFLSGLQEQRYAFKEAMKLLWSGDKQQARQRLINSVVSNCQSVPIGFLTGIILDKAAEVSAGGGPPAVAGVLIGVGALFTLNTVFGILSAADSKNSVELNTALERRTNRTISKSIEANYHESLRPEFAGRLAMVRENLWRVINSPQTALDSIGVCMGMVAATAVMTQAPWPIWVLAATATIAPGVISYLTARHWRQQEVKFQHTRRAFWAQNGATTDPASVHQLKALDAHAQMLKRSEGTYEKVVEGIKGGARINWIGSLIDRPINALCSALAVGYMVRECALGHTTVGQVSFLAFSTFGIFSGSLVSALRRSGDLLTVAPFIRALRELTAPPKDQSSKEKIARNKRGAAPLSLLNVDAGYGSDIPPVLSNITLNVKAGELMILWGRNASGKSTLFKTIDGSLPPIAGEVLIDGVRTRDLKDSVLHAEIGHVLQRPILFASLTLRENLELGAAKRDPALLSSICDALGITEMLKEEVYRGGKKERLFKDGIDTVLGKAFPGGESLSDGQGQLMAIARALYRQPRLLIVDEPTSALDSYVASKFISVLGDLTPLLGYQPTVLLITHDHYRTRIADRIAVIDRHRPGIAEVGTYDELIARDGLFAASIKEAQLEEMASRRKRRTTG